MYISYDRAKPSLNMVLKVGTPEMIIVIDLEIEQFDFTMQ